LASSWPDATPEGIAKRARRATDLRARLRALPAESGPDAAILDELLTGLIEFDRLNERFVPFTGDSGFHAAPTYSISRARISSAEDAYAVINRLNTLELYFDQHIANMRDGQRRGITAHTDPLATVMAQVSEQIVSRPEDSPLIAPFETLPDSISPYQANDIRRKARAATMKAVAALASSLYPADVAPTRLWFAGTQRGQT